MNPIAMMFALIAGVILLPALYMGVSTYADQVRATATALQMAHIQKAAEAYITTNAAAVEANSTTSSPAIITVPMLVNTGFLPNGFNALNPYGQTWQVQVLQPAANQLQALVLGVGGNAIPAKQSGMVATTAGDSGGVIGGGAGDFAVPGCSGGEACGAYAGWSVSTAGYQNVAAAHPAALIEYANNQLQSDYLYRVAVPGQPQLNTMQTNLNMGANSVNNAQNVNVNQNISAGVPGTAETGYCQTDAQGHCIGQIAAAGQSESDLPAGWWGGIISRDVYGTATIAAGTNNQVSAYMNDAGNIGANGNVVANGTVQGGYVNSTGDVNAQYNSTAGNGFLINSGQWWANNAGDSSQTGNAYVGGQVQANYDATLGTAFGSANIGWGCSPNGAIAANANGSGQVLACQGGSWQAMGGMTGYNQVGDETLPGNGSSNFGVWEFCTITGHAGAGADWLGPVAGPYVVGNHYAWDWVGSGSGTNNTAVTCWNNN
ncbi:MAG: shufflon system plasmid conjugative transfer pilus tip adhesin PilV [Acidithiobacillus sp.]